MREERIKIISEIKLIVILSLMALIVGVLTGAIDALFGRVLIAIGDFRDANLIYLLPFLGIIGVFIVWYYNKFGGKASKGMGLIFAVGHGEENDIPLILIPFVMIGTWLTHLFGGSAGREGVAVQIGGALSHWIGKRIEILYDSRTIGHDKADKINFYSKSNISHIMLITGMAAGFAGLFQTPMAATVFALEVMTVGIIEYEAIIPAIIGSFTASYISHTLGLEKFSVAINLEKNISLESLSQIDIAELIIIGVAFGLAGRLFASLLKWLKQVLQSACNVKNPVIKMMGNPYARIFVIGVILSVVLFILYHGRYTGLGTNLINYSVTGQEIYWYDWILKLLLTVITLSAGYQGGEVTPLFAIGATLGAWLATVFGLPIILIAAIGYAAVFGAATNTYFAPILIGVEVFGTEYIPLFFIVCSISYFFSGDISIYSQRKLKNGYLR